MRRALAVLPLLWLLLHTIAAADAADPVFPPLTGRVVDGAGLLSERDEAELDAALARFEAATTNQIVVVTLESLQGLPIEEYGYQLGRHWGIGQAGRDNGALLIVAPEEREVRIEVGYGLEGELTDARSRTIIETEILPHFRRGDFPSGTKAGVAAMIETLGGSYDPALPPVQVRDEPTPSPLPFFVALPILLIFFLEILFGRRRRGRRRGYGGPVIVPGGWGGRQGRSGGWGRGGGFGGGGGFRGGGGSFGGGGASGRW